MLKNALYTEETFNESQGRTLLPHCCVGCNATFSLAKRIIQQGRKGLYCSTECRIRTRSKVIQVNCSNCNKLIDKLPTKTSSGVWFCSRSCSTSFNNTKRTKKCQSKKLCCRKNCNNNVDVWTENLCSFHKQNRIEKLQVGDTTTMGELRNTKSVKNQHRSSRHNILGHRARYHLKHLLQEPCFQCGYTRHVELCHIKPLRAFSDEDLVSEANHESNVVPLCPNCHWEMDHDEEMLKSIGAKWRDRTSGLPSNSLTSQV